MAQSARSHPAVSLSLIVRFSATVPDLILSISSPQTSTSSTLSTLIRPQLPSELSKCPLRYIYAGALLPSGTSLSTVLRLDPALESHKIYIHCSVNTAIQLSQADLDAEVKDANLFVGTTASSPLASSLPNDVPPPPPAEAQGFDRLLSAGFTSTEVASLRSQFLAIQSHTHTPDNMPSGAEMRQLEERWLDSNSPAGPSSAVDDGEGSMAGGPGGLEDMLWGNVMGFFWALGAIVWLVREEGVWSKRRQIGVLTGVLVNVAFCVLRAGS